MAFGVWPTSWGAMGGARTENGLARVVLPHYAPAELRELLAGAGVRSLPPDGLPEAIVLASPFDLHGSDLFERGAMMPQSRGSMLVGHVLAPEAGERVLDLCAAPGAKTTHLAALMQGRGTLVAVERHGGRSDALHRNCVRMGAG